MHLVNEIDQLQVNLQATQQVVAEVENYRKQLAELPSLKKHIVTAQLGLEKANKLHTEQETEINTLKEKNEYLQSLITKLDRR